ncbi:MAG TPA: VOC family protein [Thermoanaerobaculia bacterium]|nr:VOC family protein [Thermoanaerobaculia bacterium]
MATKKKSKKPAAKSAPKKAKKAKKAPAKARPAAPKSALSLNDVAPGFTANDLDKSLAFYRDVLGFAVEERWEKDGKLAGVQLRAGKAVFMLGQDDWQKGRDRKKGEGFRIYLETAQDVDAVARRIEAAGGVLDQQPKDEPWGIRDFSLTDPDGFKLTIGKPLKKKR